MSLLKSPPEAPVVVIPFKVRLEPYLVESICELSRLVRDKANLHNDTSGLLFGSSQSGLRTVEALKTFVDVGPHSDLARRERLERAYKSAVDDAKADPELSTMDVVGWFSFRAGSGLLSSDVTFHNQNFRRPEDLALIIWREGPSQITAEVYSKSDSDTLTAEDYRWGSVRLSADIRHMRESVDLAMRNKLGDDSYLRAYDAAEPETHFASFMRKAEEASDKIFGLFSKRKDAEDGEKIRALIGDGRLPSSSSWPPEASESAVHRQAYFNPYAETARGMNRAPQAEALKQSAATTAGGNAAAWSTFTPEAVPAPATVAPKNLPRSPRPPQLALPPATPLDFGNLGQSPRSRRSSDPGIGGLPMIMRPVRKKSFPWPLAAALFILCCGAVFAFLSLGGLQSDGGRVGQAYRVMFPGGDLNLRVRTEDDRLRLTWNQRNPAVAAATDGTLQIFDGQQHREVHLEGRQVEDGSVLYRPVTNDITFRLEIRGEGGGTSGSVRVLDGLASQAPVLDVSAPSAQPAASTQQLQTQSAQVKDPSVPTLLRPDQAASDPSVAGLVDTPSSIVTPVPARTASPLRPQAHYETPQTVGTFTPNSSGTTINGWDTSKSRLKQRFARTPKTVFYDAGFVAPKPLMQVMPRTSTIPNGTIQTRTRVEVQVKVDPVGKVADARVVGAGINGTIASAALSAARQWTFEPATNNGQRVTSDHTIVFEFRPER